MRVCEHGGIINRCSCQSLSICCTTTMFEGSERCENVPHPVKLECVLQGVPVECCSKTKGVASKESAGFGDGKTNEVGRPAVVAASDVQKGSEVERCISNHELIKKLMPVMKPSGMKG